MRKFLARVANLTRKVAEWLVPVITAVNLLIDFVGKVANCHDRKLHTQISKCSSLALALCPAETCPPLPQKASAVRSLHYL